MKVNLERSPEERAREAIAVLERAKSVDYIGEPVSQLEHGLQAAHRARMAGQRDEVVLASLFHDVGHLVEPHAPQMDGLGTVDHESVGAEYLASLGFSAEVTCLVRLHVQAKRYLCRRNPEYLRKLSAASRGTLDWQGGPMTVEEADSFDGNPLREEILRMRVFDELAKEPHADVPGIDSYLELLVRHLKNSSEAT